MRALVGGCIIYGVAAQSQLFAVGPAPGLRGRTAMLPPMLPPMVPAVGPAVHPAPPQSSFDTATGFLGVMAGAAVGYAVATSSRGRRAGAPVVMSGVAAENTRGEAVGRGGARYDASGKPVSAGSGISKETGVKTYDNSQFAATGSGPSLMPREDTASGKSTASSGDGRLEDRLKAADIEERKAREEAEQRERKYEILREQLEEKRRMMREIPGDTAVGTVEEYMYKGGVRKELEKLDRELIGLLPVKERVQEIAALLVVDKMRMKLGFETSVPSLHMCFTGSPGTGKTTVAVRMGAILQKMGYCRSGHVVVATRDDLVGQYVGHTAPKTKEMVKKAMGGILLVDEAYYLYNASNDRDYGQESIEILLNVMENNKEDLVVILAGYKDKMDTFFSYSPGLQSRVANIIDFPNFEVQELVDIAKVMAREIEYNIAPEAEPVLKAYIERRMQLPFFSNARTVRNVMDRARMNAALRLFDEKMQPGSDGNCSEEELMEIKAADFQAILDDALNAADDAIFA